MVDLTDAGRQAIRITGRWFVGAFDHVEPSSLPALSGALTAIAADLRAHAMTMSETPK